MAHEGTITALITPFSGLKVDAEGLKFNIKRQIDAGIDGLLVLGTTGEAATLTPQEQEEVISIAVNEAKSHESKRHVPIWVGTGSYSTEQTIEKTLKAQNLGADVALIVTPYYNKPTQEGIFQHFEAICSKVNIPICVYNIPGRCGTNIEPATLLRIASLPHVMGVKEASGSVSQASEIIHIVSKNYPDFKLFCGDDALTLPMMSIGAAGVISVVSNLAPRDVSTLVRLAREGNFTTARILHFCLQNLFKLLFVETNPSPIKTAMRLCGHPAGNCRLPLVDMNENNTAMLKQELERLKLIG